MIDLPQPRWFVGGAAIALVAGIVLLSLGYNSLAPMGFFATIVLIILAAIAVTTPHVPSIEEIEARHASAAVSSEAAPVVDNEERPGDESPGAQA